MTRYEELVSECHKIAKEHDEAIAQIDHTHPLQRINVAEQFAGNIAWVLVQTLKALAKEQTP